MASLATSAALTVAAPSSLEFQGLRATKVQNKVILGGGASLWMTSGILVTMKSRPGTLITRPVIKFWNLVSNVSVTLDVAALADRP